MTADNYDFTAHLCGLHSTEAEKPGAWPMYSYERPAWIFWTGFANALLRRGFTMERIKAELQSKGTRWLLDATGDRLEKLGAELGESYMPVVS